MLNDFCNNVEANSLVLARMEPQAPPIPTQPQYPPDPYYQQPPRPPYVQQQPGYSIPPGVYQQPIMSNPFNEYDADRMDVQSQVAEMNRGINYRQQQQQPVYQQQPQPQRMQMPMPPIQQSPGQSVVDLNPDKPKTFVDKIKEMRTPKKVDKINPEE
jgi:hypothetical protein